MILRSPGDTTDSTGLQHLAKVFVLAFIPTQLRTTKYTLNEWRSQRDVVSPTSLLCTDTTGELSTPVRSRAEPSWLTWEELGEDLLQHLDQERSAVPLILIQLETLYDSQHLFIYLVHTHTHTQILTQNECIVYCSLIILFPTCILYIMCLLPCALFSLIIGFKQQQQLQLLELLTITDQQGVFNYYYRYY